MRLAVALLVVLAGVYIGSDWIGLSYANPAAASRAWFYILRGIEGVCLFAAVAALCRHRAVSAVCLLGMFQEGSSAACRASKPIGETLGYVQFAGICGRELDVIGYALFAVVALGLAYEIGRHRGKARP